MIPSTLADSTYFQYENMYKIMMQDEIAPPGTVVTDATQKIPGEEVKNAVNKICAIKYSTDGVFHYHHSGGRFGVFAFQVVSEGSLKYKIWVSIDGVNWDEKVKTILYDYVDDDFALGTVKGGTPEKPATDVFYYHVIGRLHFKIEVYDVVGKYYMLALD